MAEFNISHIEKSQSLTTLIGRLDSSKPNRNDPIRSVDPYILYSHCKYALISIYIYYKNIHDLKIVLKVTGQILLEREKYVFGKYSTLKLELICPNCT